MDETNRNSMKLDIEAARQLSAEKEKEDPKESYKKIDESDSAEETENVKLELIKNSNMVKENGDAVQDGADEKMLNGNGAGGDGEKESLAQKDVEVKFISDQLNGDVKVDIGEGGADKVFSGMSKEELMKFANDPFWIKLRWILFIFFWGLWVAMLAGAILIIISAPKCAAPVPLVWWKQGPLVTVDQDMYRNDADTIKEYGVKGVVFELPGDETYFVETEAVKNKIVQLIQTFASREISVILDLTPNYVTQNDELFKEAKTNASLRSALIWSDMSDIPNNWKSIVKEETAWIKLADSSYVLSQYGSDRYDLQMNDPISKAKFKAVLRYLIGLGVKGFRVANAKHFIISKDLKNEASSPDGNAFTHTNYNFWTHSQTTFQDGLAELLHEFARDVHNATNGDGFFSVTEDIVRPDVFKIHDTVMTIDLPEYGTVPRLLNEPSDQTAKQLEKELKNIYDLVGNSSWVQWNYKNDSFQRISGSEYNIFMMLLPGVPIVSLDALQYGAKSREIIHDLEKFRHQDTYMHGSFDVFTDVNETIIGYARIKSGNPGYFVALNPTQVNITADFSHVSAIPGELTVILKSDHYDVEGVAEKTKMSSNAIKLSPLSAIVLTYVPK